MAIDPQEFLATAKDLLAANRREADRRTSISRAYYGVYMRFRERKSAFRIAPAVLNVSIGKSLKHDKLIRALKECTDPLVRRIANVLHEIYTERVAADYDTQNDVSLATAQRVYDSALALNAAIDNFGLANLAKELEAHLRTKYASYLPPGV